MESLHGYLSKSLRPTHVVFLYLDHLQISLITRLRFKYDVVLSGILFKPTLHYPVIRLSGGFVEGAINVTLVKRLYCVLLCRIDTCAFFFHWILMQCLI